MADAQKQASELAQNLKKAKQELEKSGEEGKKIAKALGDSVKAAQKLNKLTKSTRAESAKFTKDIKDRKKQSVAMANAFKQGGGHVKGMWKAFRSGDFEAMQDAAKGAERFTKTIKTGATAASKMGGLMGAAGKALKGLSSGIGGVATKLAGPVGLAASIGMQIIKGAIAIDKYIKSLNKSFALVRGPDILTGDVKKQFREFNMSILNAADNIRDGLNAQDVIAWAESVNAAGMRVSSLSKGLYTYRDIVHIAAKASKVFGVEIVAAGNFMTQMMLNQRLNVEDLKDAFVSLSFSASRSGLNTDKFWNAVQNATASLAFYGKYVKEVGQTLASFQEKQVTGMEENIALTQDLTQAFSKAGVKVNMAIAGIAGAPAILAARFTEASKKALEEATAAEKRIVQLKILGAPAEEITKAQYEQIKYLRQASRYQQAAKGGQVAMAQNLSGLADQAPEILLDLLKGTDRMNITNFKEGEKLYASLVGSNKVLQGLLTEDQFRVLVENARASSELLLRLIDINGASGQSLIDTIDNMTREQKGALNTKLSALTAENLDETVELLQNSLNISEEEAKVVAKAAVVDDKIKTSLSNIFDENYKGTETTGELLQKITKLANSGDIARKIGAKHWTETKARETKNTDQYQKTFEQVRNSTLSMEDMVNIAKEDAKYRLATLAQLDIAASGVTALVNEIVGPKKDEQVTGVMKETNAKMKAAKDALDQINDQIKENAAKQSALNTKTATADDKIKLAQLKENMKMLKIEQKAAETAVGRHQDMMEVLTAMKASSEKLNDLQMTSILGDPEMLKKIWSGLDIGKEGLTRGQIMKKFKNEDLTNALFALGKQTNRITYKDPVTGQSLYNPRLLQAPATETATDTVKQGLRIPETVTSAGPVLLHPGETIFPAGDMRTRPAGPGAGGNITVNVNATFKDIAQTIANAVHGVLRQQQVGTPG
jgi:hypothetical protein